MDPFLRQKFLEYEQSKKIAIRQVYREIARMYRDQLKNTIQVPDEYLALKRRIRYRVTMTDRDITMIVGFVRQADYADEIGRQMHFLIHGSRKHWVSLKAHPMVGQWAVRTGIVEKQGNDYYWRDGTKTRAIQVSNRAQKAQVLALKSEIYRKLESRLKEVMK